MNGVEMYQAKNQNCSDISVLELLKAKEIVQMVDIFLSGHKQTPVLAPQ